MIKRIKKLKKHKVVREISGEIEYFHREFRKHLTNFITGALAFVAALLWRDAISTFIEIYQKSLEKILPFKGIWFTKFVMALFVSVIAVIGIVIMSRILKPKE